MMQTHKKPHHARNVAGLSYRPSNSVQNSNTLPREIVATLTLGALIAIVMWSSVFGMSSDFTSGPVVPVGFDLAEVRDGE